MDVGATLKARAQPAHLVQPGEAALTTQRRLPKPEPWGVRRRAMSGRMRKALSQRLCGSAS